MKKILNMIPTASFVLAIITLMFVVWGGYQNQKYKWICGSFDSAVPIENADELTAAQVKEYDGKLICLAGDLSVKDTPVDPLTGISAPGALVLERKVEMYQYSVSGDKVVMDFYDHQVRNISGKGGESYENPVFPSELGSVTMLANVCVGPVTLGEAYVDAFDRSYQYVDRAEYIALKPETSAGNDQGLTLRDGFYTNGDPDAPQLGDIRISYQYVDAAQYAGRMVFFGTLRDGVLVGGETDGNAFMMQHCDSLAQARETIATSSGSNARGLFFMAWLNAAAAVAVLVIVNLVNKRKVAR